MDTNAGEDEDEGAVAAEEARLFLYVGEYSGRPLQALC